MNKKLWLFLTITVWVGFFVASGLIYYVNHYLPHGTSYPTGNVVCQNDDRGPCGEVYKEDLRGLNIPSWAKFFKQSEGELLWIALLFASIVISGYRPGSKENYE